MNTSWRVVLAAGLLLASAWTCADGTDEAASPEPTPTPAPPGPCEVGPMPTVTPAAAAPPEVAFGGPVTVSFADAEVCALVASTPAQRQRGLMFRTSMPADTGMLFLFSAPSEGGFWMKNTLIPLSIAYMHSDGDGYRVVSILDMEPCEADPCPSYPAGEPYDATLEVNQGWFADHGIEVGDVARVEGDTPTPS